MNEQESASLWKLYRKSEEVIAVQSTYNKLRVSITGDEKVFLGIVKYVYDETEWMEWANLLTPLLHKRKSLEHEREVRALVTKDSTQEPIGQGLKIKIDVEGLVERIYIAPSAPVSFADLVRAVIQRYGFNFDVGHSKLNEQPVF